MKQEPKPIDAKYRAATRKANILAQVPGIFTTTAGVFLAIQHDVPIALAVTGVLVLGAGGAFMTAGLNPSSDLRKAAKRALLAANENDESLQRAADAHAVNDDALKAFKEGKRWPIRWWKKSYKDQGASSQLGRSSE